MPAAGNVVTANFGVSVQPFSSSFFEHLFKVKYMCEREAFEEGFRDETAKEIPWSLSAC